MISTSLDTLIIIFKCLLYYTIILPLYIFLNKFNSFISLNLISISENNNLDLNNKRNINTLLNEIKEFDDIIS